MALARSLMLWTCRYRPVVAGFIGPNGAGKTTTLRMLLGLVRPSGGSGQVFGRPLDTPAGYLPRVGALIESPAFYRELSGERNLAVQFAVERGALDQRTDARQVTGRRIKRPAEDLSATATWSDQAKQHPQRGRLAGPVRADEPRHNTGRYLHVQSIND